MKLYAKDAKGKIRVWQIEESLGGFTMTSGLNGGNLVSKFVNVYEKANRTFREQVELEMKSRIKRKKDSGFVEDINTAVVDDRTNSLGFELPMLAKAKVYDYDTENSLVQTKLDGLRCMIRNVDGINYAYSKTGQPYSALTHILGGIKIPEGVTIDGELYHHGTQLQMINSWVKRKQDDTIKLKYHCYDVISDSHFAERLEMIQGFNLGVNAEVVDTWNIKSIDVFKKFQEVRSDGYEGLIIRQPGYGYQAGKRNKAMIKLKEFLDDEFQVMDITPSKDGMAILNLESSTGKPFKVFAPGTHDNKVKILEDKSNYISELITIEYAGLSADGVPIQPVAKRFRDPVNE